MVTCIYTHILTIDIYYDPYTLVTYINIEL
jgi:hypothetical protein